MWWANGGHAFIELKIWNKFESRLKYKTDYSQAKLPTYFLLILNLEI